MFRRLPIGLVAIPRPRLYDRRNVLFDVLARVILLDFIWKGKELTFSTSKFLSKPFLVLLQSKKVYNSFRRRRMGRCRRKCGRGAVYYYLVGRNRVHNRFILIHFITEDKNVEKDMHHHN